MRFIPVLFSLFCIAAVRLYGQCPTPDFDIPVSTCLQSLTEIENLSSPADSYSWDFCTGDLSNTPQAQASFILPAANGRPGIEFAKDGNTWFGFVTGTWSNTLYRIEFANGTDALPTATENLGSLSGSLNGPGPIEIINEAGRWYGFVYNASSGELLKLDFGNSLSNKITVSVIFAGSGSINAGIALGKDQSNGWVCVLSTSSNQFKIIRLGNLISLPGPGDIIISGTIPNPNNLGDVDIINVCGMWYGFADNLGNGNLYRLDFGTNLFSVPVINQINTISAGNPGRLSIVKEGEEYFLFVIALDGTLTKLEFGKDLTSIPVIIQEGDIGSILQSNTYGIGVAKENSEWTILAVNATSGQVYHVNYPNICGATPRVSNQMSPEVTYAQAGVYKVSLESTYALGTSTKTKSISVSSSIAPDISFASQNICANHDVNFTSQNTSGNITGYDWNFGDTNTSMVQDPTYQYATASDYEVSLQVTASNGCNNLARESITIYNVPVANFDPPPVNPFCTNQEYTFTNTSSFDIASNPIWEWSLNGSVVSSSKDLLTQFSTTSVQEIKLKASIPGCESESIQNVSTVLQGPAVDFNAANGCEESPVNFVNTSSGTVAGYTWDFGDGNQSSLVNPTNTFLSHGNFDVVLTATNASGCENSKTKSVTIYSKPQTNFSIDLPPFSCSGSTSQFNDLTPSLTDSNITTWTWNFGDVASGTASQKNPTYVYGLAGDYQVALETSTNFGCSNSIQKTVTISPAPLVDFTYGPSCLNQGTQFTDASGSNVKAWLWSMQNNTYTSKNPIHTFNSTGDQSVTLAVTGNNNCVSQVSKTLSIPVPVIVDFTAQGTCATKPSIFQETTIAGPDPATSWSWDIDGTPTVGSPVQHVFQNVGNYNVQLYSTRQSGCVYSATKLVNVIAPPVAQFSMSPVAGAPPLPVEFTNISVGASSFLWKFNDVNNSTSTLFSPSFTYTTLGEYPVDLIVRNTSGCTDTTQKIVQVVIPQINVAMTELTVSNNGDGSLRATVTIKNESNLTIQNPVVFLNLSGNAQVKEVVSASILPGQSITRTLSTSILPVNVSYVCAEVVVNGDTDQSDNEKCISIVNESVFIQPYPNPANDIVYLEWVNTNLESLDVAVYNSLGQSVFSKTYSGLSPGLNQVELYVSNLAEGIYFATYVSDNQTFSIRFSIVR